MAKIVRVLYHDPVGGYPESCARDQIPAITRYDNGQTAPTPSPIDFVPGQLLGSVSGELGLRKYVEGLGHQLVVTSDKVGDDSVFERELPDVEGMHVGTVAAGRIGLAVLRRLKSLSVKLHYFQRH